VIERMLPFPMPARSLPADWKTAYPRRQTECPDPERGLSSVEALFLAHQILGRSTEGLLARYHWRDQFLAQFASAHR
jgi:pre-rRNA-processing protein TSR3